MERAGVHVYTACFLDIEIYAPKDVQMILIYTDGK